MRPFVLSSDVDTSTTGEVGTRRRTNKQALGQTAEWEGRLVSRRPVDGTGRWREEKLHGGLDNLRCTDYVLSAHGTAGFCRLDDVRSLGDGSAAVVKASRG